MAKANRLPTRYNFQDLAGQVFGRWTVVAFAGIKKTVTHWRCRCLCGIERDVCARNLKTGISQSCGCLQKELLRKPKSHGMSGSAEYRSWCAMKSRCYNPRNNRFAKYGGRGIRVCERWLNSFECFYADMGPRPTPKHSIDRKDNDGNYEPNNCVWATHKEQTNNQSKSRHITANGTTHTLAEWSEITRLPYATIRSRLKRGWSADRAVG